MTLLTVIVVLLVVGVCLHLLNVYMPMDPKIKQILNVTVVVVVILWLLSAFGVWGHLKAIHIG